MPVITVLERMTYQNKLQKPIFDTFKATFLEKLDEESLRNHLHFVSFDEDRNIFSFDRLEVDLNGESERYFKKSSLELYALVNKNNRHAQDLAQCAIKSRYVFVYHLCLRTLALALTTHHAADLAQKFSEILFQFFCNLTTQGSALRASNISPFYTQLRDWHRKQQDEIAHLILSSADCSRHKQVVDGVYTELQAMNTVIKKSILCLLGCKDSKYYEKSTEDVLDASILKVINHGLNSSGSAALVVSSEQGDQFSSYLRSEAVSQRLPQLLKSSRGGDVLQSVNFQSLMAILVENEQLLSTLRNLSDLIRITATAIVLIRRIEFTRIKEILDQHKVKLKTATDAMNRTGGMTKEQLDISFRIKLADNFPYIAMLPSLDTAGYRTVIEKKIVQNALSLYRAQHALQLKPEQCFLKFSQEEFNQLSSSSERQRLQPDVPSDSAGVDIEEIADEPRGDGGTADTEPRVSSRPIEPKKLSLSDRVRSKADGAKNSLQELTRRTYIGAAAMDEYNEYTWCGPAAGGRPTGFDIVSDSGAVENDVAYKIIELERITDEYKNKITKDKVNTITMLKNMLVAWGHVLGSDVPSRERIEDDDFAAIKSIIALVVGNLVLNSAEETKELEQLEEFHRIWLQKLSYQGKRTVPSRQETGDLKGGLDILLDTVRSYVRKRIHALESEQSEREREEQQREEQRRKAIELEHQSQLAVFHTIQHCFSDDFLREHALLNTFEQPIPDVSEKTRQSCCAVWSTLQAQHFQGEFWQGIKNDVLPYYQGHVQGFPRLTGMRWNAEELYHFRVSYFRLAKALEAASKAKMHDFPPEFSRDIEVIVVHELAKIGKRFPWHAPAKKFVNAHEVLLEEEPKIVRKEGEPYVFLRRNLDYYEENIATLMGLIESTIASPEKCNAFMRFWDDLMRPAKQQKKHLDYVKANVQLSNASSKLVYLREMQAVASPAIGAADADGQSHPMGEVDECTFLIQRELTLAGRQGITITPEMRETWLSARIRQAEEDKKRYQLQRDTSALKLPKGTENTMWEPATYESLKSYLGEHIPDDPRAIGAEKVNGSVRILQMISRHLTLPYKGGNLFDGAHQHILEMIDALQPQAAAGEDPRLKLLVKVRQGLIYLGAVPLRTNLSLEKRTDKALEEFNHIYKSMIEPVVSVMLLQAKHAGHSETVLGEQMKAVCKAVLDFSIELQQCLDASRPWFWKVSYWLKPSDGASKERAAVLQEALHLIKIVLNESLHDESIQAERELGQTHLSTTYKESCDDLGKSFAEYTKVAENISYWHNKGAVGFAKLQRAIQALIREIQLSAANARKMHELACSAVKSQTEAAAAKAKLATTEAKLATTEAEKAAAEAEKAAAEAGRAAAEAEKAAAEAEKAAAEAGRAAAEAEKAAAEAEKAAAEEGRAAAEAEKAAAEKGIIEFIERHLEKKWGFYCTLGDDDIAARCTEKFGGNGAVTPARIVSALTLVRMGFFAKEGSGPQRHNTSGSEARVTPCSTAFHQ